MALYVLLCVSNPMKHALRHNIFSIVRIGVAYCSLEWLIGSWFLPQRKCVYRCRILA